MKTISKTLTCLLFIIQLSPALASPVMLANGNSIATLDPLSQTGMSQWTVDGTNYLQQQWFWFRSGQVSLTSIDSLTLDLENQVDNSQLQLRYGTSSTFWIDISYELIGGSMGSGTAMINETIKITNNSTSGLNFSFFQYSDFDLSANNDSVEITNNDTATQKGGELVLTETMSTIFPNTFRMEANTAPNTRNSLNTNMNYQLNLTAAAGPGNVTWAFQWDRGLFDVGNSFEITKTKTIVAQTTNPIPEPSTFLLFGTGILLTSLARSRQWKKSSL